MTKRFILIFLLLTTYYFLHTLSAQGAELKLTKSIETMGIGDIFDVSLVLNTEEESINAIEAILKYSDNLELKNISDGNSIINLWISKPRLNDIEGSIFFSGLIPGGIKTGEGAVLNLTFKGLSDGVADIQVKDMKVFINDQDASEVEVKTTNLNFDIQNNPGVARQSQKLVLDFLPPDKFEVYLSKDKNVFDDAWFISFNAQDKGSGIDYYEVKESLLGIFGQWIKADSPYQLYYQSLFSIIKVRVVDNVGREREALFVPLRLFVFGTAFIGLVVSILLLKMFKYLKAKYNKENI